MVILLLLKLRKKLEKVRNKESMEELQKLVANDIMKTIDRNVEIGNISSTDAFDLKALTTMLYMKIYSKYEELEDFTMRLYDQSLELPSDKYEKTVEELENEVKEMKDVIEAKDESLREKDESLREKDESLRMKDVHIKEQEQIIKELKRQLEEKQKK